MYTRTTDPIEMLTEVMNEAMMKSSEVLPATEFADDAFRIEKETGHEFTKVELLQIWHNAADYMVDSHIANEYDTPDSCRYCDKGETPADVKERAIARWEAMRPSTKRIAKLTQLLMF